jgi:hypothetical protein
MAVAWVAECVAVREANYLNYPDELVRAVGLVVLYAAWAEDKAGELISLHHGIHEATPHRDWAASGERLCKALEVVSCPGNGSSSAGTGAGVWGDANVSQAAGVHGRNFAAWGPGVMGEVTGDGYAIFGLSNTSYAGLFEGRVLMAGNVQIYGTLSKPGGSFRIDHPLDPRNKYLSHSFVESPDMLNIYNGLVQLDDHGAAVVELPEWFDALNHEFRYQLTPIGAPAPNLHVAREIEKRAFQIGGGTANGKVSWQVTGIRQDKWANANRIQVEEDKSYADRDRYLHPELFGESKDKTIMPGPRPKMTPPDKRPAHHPTVP